MAKPKRPASDICLTIRDRPDAIDGVDICRKSKGHTSSEDPARREHYDPSSEQRWADDKDARMDVPAQVAARYAAAVVKVLASDFPAVTDHSLGRLALEHIARQAEAPMRSFEVIVTYTREWRLVPERTGRDRWRVQIACHMDAPTAADGERERRINATLRALAVD